MSDTAVLKTMPCGKANFAVIRERRMAFVDKTRFIETLENCGSDYPFIVRPRRFGKSLTVSMLTAYYDEAAAPQFETTFANTYIGSHKTALASSFRVLHFDFSGLASSAKIAEDFQNRVRDCLIEYFAKYPHPQQSEILNRPFNTAASLISSFFALLAVEEFQKIYVIIDEYDQFANEILSKDLSHFQSITSAQGFLKDFYTCLKSATSKAVARVFFTGVTSISLDSMTSGFNIASNLTIDPAFASYVGFTEAELRQFIPQVVDASRCGMTIDEMLVYIPQLTKRKNKLLEMKSKLLKERVEEQYGRQSNIIDYTYTNYDIALVEADYEKAADELSRAQLALDTVNQRESFEFCE